MRSTAAPPAEQAGAAPRRGRLKVYLGATPGAGKTYAMLRDAHRLRAQGHDIVIGFVETYNRPRTIELIEGLEVVPRRRLEYRGTSFEDMDVHAVLARKPEIALVDELAHANVPGMEHEKPWQDVEDLRGMGIDVFTTVNVQHVESVKDLVEKVTGVIVRETLPDRVLDGADELHFIDITPEALRKRMRHGNVYAKEKVETALANFFRPQNLAAMREIGLRLVADSMARSSQVLASPEDVLVAVSGGGASEELMRRGARLARRLGGACMVVMVRRADQAEPAGLRALARQLGASFTVLSSPDVAGSIIEAATETGAEHVVIGEEARATGFAALLRPTIADRVIDALPHADVHVIARMVQ